MVIDVGSIGALISSLTSAGEMTKAIVGLRDAAMINSKVIELQGIIMTAQSSAMAAQSDQFALLNRVRELEEEMTRMKKWDAESERYELKNIYTGAVAYVLKPDAQGSESPHWLCANCFENKKKSYLQQAMPMQRNMIYKCIACGNMVSVHASITPLNPWNPGKAA